MKFRPSSTAACKRNRFAPAFLGALFAALTIGQAGAQDIPTFGPFNGTAKATVSATAVAVATNPPATAQYPKGWTQCANEGSGCWFPGTVRDVAYGAGGSPSGYRILHSKLDNAMCNTATFYGIDPAPGKTKACYISNTPSRLATATPCAVENGTCAFIGFKTVWFGSEGRYAPKIYGNKDPDDTTSHSVSCSVTEFGFDPSPGHPKFCLVTAR